MIFEILSTLFFLPTATSKMVPKRKFEIHLETEKSNASNRIYHGPLATAQTKIYVMFLSRLSWKNVFQKLILQRTDLKNFFNCKNLDLLNSHMQQKTGKELLFFICVDNFWILGKIYFLKKLCLFSFFCVQI